MQLTEQANGRAADLYWLAYLLTGERAPSLDLTLETLDLDNRTSGFYSSWMLSWSRRVVISKALAAVREELGASARRTESWRVGRTAPAPPNWQIAPGANKIQLERALLAIDIFPRCALVLSIFEKLSPHDTAVLLGTDTELIRKAQVIGLVELTRNLARMQGGTCEARAGGAARRRVLLPFAAVLLAFAAPPLRAADTAAFKLTSRPSLASARAVGKGYYSDGEFKKAAAQLRRAVELDPNDAESHYWLGMSYEKLADMAIPFDGKYRSKARTSLKMAMDLAPDRPDYRRELFDALLDVDGFSSASFRQAADILRAVPDSDPDRPYMRWRLADERRANSAIEARLATLFLASPRVAYRLADLPASAIRGGSRAREER